jgi:DNA-binding LacI/PurR family transcriptional regulator
MDYEDSRKADGIILLGYGDYLEYQSRLEQLVSQGTHFVRWGAVLEGQPGLSVGCDNFRGGYDAAQHLLKLGRKDIAFLGNAGNNYPEFQERYRGYAAALQKTGRNANPALQVDGLSSEADGRAAAEMLLQRRLPFDAVVAASDLLAIGAIRHLQERGWQVPQQVAFVGFDDIPAASMASPPLTTVVQDTRRAGEVLVDTLLRLVGGEPAVGTVLPTRLVVRASCGS